MDGVSKMLIAQARYISRKEVPFGVICHKKPCIVGRCCPLTNGVVIEKSCLFLSAHLDSELGVLFRHDLKSQINIWLSR